MIFEKYLFQGKDPKSVMKELKNQVDSPSFIMFLSDYENFPIYSKLLHEQYPNISVIGTTGMGFAGNDYYDGNGLCVAAFDSNVEAAADVLEDIEKCPLKYIQRVHKVIEQVGAMPGSTVCFEYCTSAGEYVVSTLNVALEQQGIPLVGGITTNVPEGSDKLVSVNGRCYKDAAVFAIIKNKHGSVQVDRENIYTPRPQKYVITKSDNRNLIYALNGQKAVDVYANALGVSHAELEDKIITNPLCRTMGDEHFLCAIKAFNDDGSITTYKYVQDNDTMQITDIMDNYKEITRDTMERERANGGVAVLTVNCLFRYIYFDSLGYVSEYAHMTEGQMNHFGMVAEGEEVNNQHVNQSMVYVCFR